MASCALPLRRALAISATSSAHLLRTLRRPLSQTLIRPITHPLVSRAAGNFFSLPRGASFSTAAHSNDTSSSDDDEDDDDDDDDEDDDDDDDDDEDGDVHVAFPQQPQRWTVSVKIPGGVKSLDDRILFYENTAAKVFGSVEEARKRICSYGVSYEGFMVECTDDLKEKLIGTTGVRSVILASTEPPQAEKVKTGPISPQQAPPAQPNYEPPTSTKKAPPAQPNYKKVAAVTEASNNMQAQLNQAQAILKKAHEKLVWVEMEKAKVEIEKENAVNELKEGQRLLENTINNLREGFWPTQK